jgi:DNA repair protein RecN (Recombination protein N)
VSERHASSPALRRIEIEDFGLIARADVDFAAGLSVFSGETGSGKTMLLGALGFVLGERSSPDMVHGGALRARVTLEVDTDEPLREAFLEAGFEVEPGEPAIFTRELQTSGKSSARINGRPATAAQLRETAARFADFIGQHEQQRLLSPTYQLELLDRYAGAKALALRDSVAASYARVAELERELAETAESEGRGLAEVEFARFALGEIDAAAAQPGEDERLRERREYLANAERISGALGQAHDALAGADGSAVTALGAAARALGGVSRYGGELTRLADSIAALQSEATDAAVEIARAADAVESDAAELETIGERLDAIDRLKKKYGPTIEAVLESRTRFESIVERYAGREERCATLQSWLGAEKTTLATQSDDLGKLRTAAARKLENSVAEELRALAMPAARFAVNLERSEAIGRLGRERSEFALAPNPGEPLRSLARAASGGELSRVLLALVVVLADRREPTALIFDEIDAGVGGATANAVAQRLSALARDTQVVCVTHLAQIASWAERHYALVKRERRDATTIEVVALSERKAVLEELARMLSGKVEGIAIEHAETLLRDAQKRRTSQR